MSTNIYRLHYRGQLKEGISEAQVKEAIAVCEQNIRQAQAQKKVLTAALYQYGRMLFFYYEAIGEPLQVTEPASIAVQPGEASDAIGVNQNVIPESGEDVQSTCLHPDELLVPLSPYLQVWPGQADDRLWVHMYYIYCHSYPKSAEDWARAGKPQQRLGRIAFLRDDKLFNYVYYHKEIVDEGLLSGDKYQSIALHENILFSYFEEPKTMTNVRGDLSKQSQVIHDWQAQDPGSHFIRMPGGGHFLFIPALFALGVEDDR